MGRKSASGSGIRDEHPGSYFLELRNHFFVVLGILKFLNDAQFTHAQKVTGQNSKF
jgi:hypothetical protein